MNKFILITFLVAYSLPCHSESTAGYIDFNVGPMKRFNAEIPLLEKPGGKIVGSIILANPSGWFGLSNPTINERPVIINKMDKWRLDYSSSIKFYEERGDYARILANSIKGGLWLQLTHSFEGENLHVRLGTVNWTPRIRGTLWEIYGYHNYRLREMPSKKSGVLLYINRNRHIISHGTGRIKDHWAEVVVVEVKPDPHEVSISSTCYSSLNDIREYLTGNQWVGWIKVLGDNGELNDIRDDGMC